LIASPSGAILDATPSVSNIEQVIEQIRSFSGADFAFLLTRRGRLVTRGAPREMSEAGRARLVALAEPLVGTDGIGELTLPREDLVPFGGAAPVDVYVAVAAEKAIVCAVMPTWAAKSRIIPAMKAGIRALGPLIEGQEASARRRRMEVASEGRAPESRPPASKPPESRSGAKSKRTHAGLLSGSGPTTHASRTLEQAPAIKSVPPPPGPAMPSPAPAGREGSMPSITLGEATLGRESLAAIEAELEEATPRAPASSIPSITVGQATLGRESVEAIEAEQRALERATDGPLPSIPVEQATLERESAEAIAVETRSPETSAPDDIRLELDTAPDLPPLSELSPSSSRTTQPWVESAEDAKRAADAARADRSNRAADDPPADTLTWGTPRWRLGAPAEPRPGKRRR
jgi:hypothetical protein